MPKRIPATLILAISALLSRLLGVLRDHLLARNFGASAGEGIFNLDTYYAAFRIPDLLYNLLIFGAISAAFIPIFTQYKKEKKMKEAWAFASNMLHLMLIVVLALSGLIYIFAPQFTHLVGAGFDQEAFDLTVKLMRIMLLSPIIFTFSAIFISIQDSFKSFFFRSLAPIFYNLGIILGIFYFAEEFGVVGVTWGVIIGAVLQLIIQLPALKQLGYKHVWIFRPKQADTLKAIRLIIPRVIGLSMTQITLLINTLIASFLVTGSITVFYLADNLQALPLGIIGISFAITSFATLSELAMEKTPKNFSAEISRVSQKILFLIIPATLGMYFLKDKIVDIILVAGKFSSSDATVLQTVLGLLLISLFAQSLIPLFSRGFYAYHDTKTPVITALASSVVSIAGAYFLAIQKDMGISGIAIAVTVGNILNFLLLYVLMAKKCQSHLIDFWNVFKMLVSGLGMYFVVRWLDGYLSYDGTILNRLFILLLLTLVGAATYFLMAWMLRIPERKMIG